jgi:hypothetical protein
MFILGGIPGVAGGGGGATGRGRGRGGAAGGGAGTPGRGGMEGDASGDGGGAGRAAGGVGSGGGGPTGRGSGSGGAVVLGGDATGCGTGGVAMGGGAAGRGVPQYPQNLLPAGNDLWHFGHMTWGTAVGTGARCGGADGAAGTGDDPRFWGFPQRTQAGADAGFIAPQEAQRMYRTVPCSLPSGVMFYAHLDLSRHHSPVALIQMGLV